MDETRQLWLINTADNTEQPLASDYDLSNFMVWGNSDTLLLGAWLSPDEADGPNNGHIASLNIASGDLRILDEDNLSGNRPALAPDGQTIAFDTYLSGSQIYPADGRLQPFDPTAFTAVNELQSAMLFNPAWSPDVPSDGIPETRPAWAPHTRDPKLAWLNSTGERVALQVYDLTQLTALQLFDWDPARFGALIPSPVWNPGGQWLALEVWTNNTEDNGLWLLAADGSSQIHLDDSAGSPFWYNAAQLSYCNPAQNTHGSIEMYDWTNDKTYVIDLPANSLLVGLTDAADLSPEPTAPPAAAALPFEAATFRSDPFGFEFDYPAAWTISNLGGIGSRGSATQFLEGDRIAMQMAFYLWDPRNDLAAYIDHWRTAWTASGMTLLAEEDWLLDTDHPAASFVIQGQGGEEAYFFYTTIADRYLELSGDQEIDLLAAIAGTMRLFEPVPSSDAAGALGCLVAAAGTAESVACNVMDGIRSRNTAALPSFMVDPFSIGYWRSEGISVTPAEAIAELGNALLPADPVAHPLTFTTDRTQFPSLLGIPVEGMFGPDVDIAHIIYSEGWGLDGQGAALIFIAQNEDRFYWHGLVFSSEHFDK
jgi:hypothetical protein